MRRSAGQSTCVTRMAVAAAIGSSHFRLLGRMAFLGAAFTPLAKVEASTEISCLKPGKLHAGAVCDFAEIANRTRVIRTEQHQLPLKCSPPNFAIGVIRCSSAACLIQSG